MNQWPTELQGQDSQRPLQQQAQDSQWSFQPGISLPQRSPQQQPQFQEAIQSQAPQPQWSGQLQEQQFSAPVQQPRRQFQWPIQPQVPQPDWPPAQGSQFKIPALQPQVPPPQPVQLTLPQKPLQIQQPQFIANASRDDNKKRRAPRIRRILTIVVAGLILLGVVAGAVLHYLISPPSMLTSPTSVALSFEKARLHGDYADAYSLTCPANRQTSKAPANLQSQAKIDDSKLGTSIANASFNQATVIVEGSLLINNGPTWGSSSILVHQSIELQANGIGWCVAKFS